jgi:hypothetical protein
LSVKWDVSSCHYPCFSFLSVFCVCVCLSVVCVGVYMCCASVCVVCSYACTCVWVFFFIFFFLLFFFLFLLFLLYIFFLSFFNQINHEMQFAPPLLAPSTHTLPTFNTPLWFHPNLLHPYITPSCFTTPPSML